MGSSIVRTTTHIPKAFLKWLTQYLPGISKLFAYIKDLPRVCKHGAIFFSIAEWPTQLLVWCTIWIILSRFYLLPHACSYNHNKLSYLLIIIFGGQLKYISTLVGLHLLNLSWGTSVLGWEGGCKGNWENC